MALVQAGARQLEYCERGSGEKLLVLIHGAGSSAMIWDSMQNLLATAGIRTIAISLPGAAQSDRPSSLSDYCPDSYAVDIKNTLNTLGIKRFSIAGHSLGVSNVLSLLDDHGTDFDVRAMIMIAGGGGDPRPAPEDEQIKRLIAEWSPSDPRFAVDKREDWEQLHLGLSQTARDALWTDIQNNPSERTLGQQICAFQDRTAFLNSTEIPTLVISGDCDSVVPVGLTLKMFHKLSRKVRSLHVMCGVEHYPNAEVPEELSRVIDQFLTRNY